MPKVNCQFGKDIIPNIFDGERLWEVGSKLYLSAQCVDACEILLEWLVSEKEHVTDTALQIRCDEEGWDCDHINTIQSSHIGLFICDNRNQEYNLYLVTAQARIVADVSERVQELEDMVGKYEEHEGCFFPTAFKIQRLMDILPENAERQLTLESTNTKPNFESLKNRVSQWVSLNHRGRPAMDCSHVGNGGHSGESRHSNERA